MYYTLETTGLLGLLCLHFLSIATGTSVGPTDAIADFSPWPQSCTASWPWPSSGDAERHAVRGRLCQWDWHSPCETVISQRDIGDYVICWTQKYPLSPMMCLEDLHVLSMVQKHTPLHRQMSQHHNAGTHANPTVEGRTLELPPADRKFLNGLSQKQLIHHFVQDIQRHDNWICS